MLACTRSGREREALIQAAKMAGAAVAAWTIARAAIPAPQSFMAPYAAVFLMTTTVYRSLTGAAQQTCALLAGLAVAYLTTLVFRQPMLTLGVAVFAGMIVGQWHRFGTSGIWTGVTALLMVCYGTAQNLTYLAYWMAEILLGSAIGVAVNMIVLPPMHLRRTREAVDALAGELRELLASIAAGLTEHVDLPTAAHWQHQARLLDATVRRADDALGQGRESLRWNPRWLVRRRRDWHPAVSESPFRTLSEVSEQVKRLTEAVATGAEYDEFGEVFAPRLAHLVTILADAVACLDATHAHPARLDAYLDELRTAHADTAAAVRDLSERHIPGHAQQAALLAVVRSMYALDAGTE
ncbi:FUSC family protein [Nocardia cerradoensis]|uniref:FUSC family protein n=1 Tax=Nocardia cerradoensis TaxID=85688 RepID=UPI0002D4D836|nr:FUSC family protein [Nocardia cerradoensis]